MMMQFASLDGGGYGSSSSELVIVLQCSMM